MSRLMVRRYLLLLLADYLRLLLGTDAYLHKRSLDIILGYIFASFFRRKDRGLVHEALKIRSGKARRRSCDLLKIDIFRKGLVL